MESIVSETDSTASFLYSLIMDYFSSFILLACPCVCVYLCFPLSFMFSPQARAPQEGGVKAEVLSHCFFCFFSPPLHSHSSLLLPDLPLKHPCFCFIKSGFFLCVCVHCDFFSSLQPPPPPPPQRARSEPGYRVPPPQPADVRTPRDTLIQLLPIRKTPS